MKYGCVQDWKSEIRGHGAIWEEVYEKNLDHASLPRLEHTQGQ